MQQTCMSAPVTFAVPHAFLGARPHDRGAAVCIAGVPLDIGTTNRAGARDGPRAIRAAARMLTDGRHPITGASPASLDLSDLGEFEIALGDMEKSLALIEDQAMGLAHLVAFGGEHSITLALLRALRKRIGEPPACSILMRIWTRMRIISAKFLPMGQCSGMRCRKG